MRISASYTSILLFFFFFFITINESIAKEKRYTVKVYGMDNKTTRGVLASVTDKGVYVSQRKGVTAVFVDASQIKEIKLRRKGKSSTGSTIGFFTGVAAGVTGVVALHSTDDLNNTLTIVGAALTTFITTAIGGAIGSQYDAHFYINGRTEDYLQTLKQLKAFTPAVH